MQDLDPITMSEKENRLDIAEVAYAVGRADLVVRLST